MHTETPGRGSREGGAESYEEARPVEPQRVLRETEAAPEEAVERLDAARDRLTEWLREHPAHLPAAREDLEALERAQKRARKEARREAEREEKDAAKELSRMLRGVPGEDAFKAHAALRTLLDAVEAGPSGHAPEARDGLPDDIPHFDAKLRPYQAEGVRFLLERGLNAILADDMGLGKTVMAVAAVEAADRRAFVVSPANALYNWKEEVEDLTDEEPAVYHRGERHGPPDARFLLTTYDALQSLDPEAVDLDARDVLILDEAHYVRNPRTKRARLVRDLPQARRILLTGTPLVNGLEDYYELLRQVDPDRWGTRSEFKQRWIPEPALYNKYAQVRNATAALLQRAASDVLLRRTKDEVLPDLPPRIVRVRHHELAPLQLKGYRRREAAAARALESNGEEGAVFQALHDLRQYLAASRVPAALERVRDLNDRGARVVVYSEYLDPLHRLAEKLGEDAVTLEGSTPPRERQEITHAFDEDGEGPRTILAQIEAGGVGVNLTAASHVLFLHFGWTPAVHEQAMDRVHRIGQDQPVLVEFFVTPGTIDERMARILLRKEEDQNLVLADDSDFLNRGELARLLAEDAARRAEAGSAAGGAP